MTGPLDADTKTKSHFIPFRWLLLAAIGLSMPYAYATIFTALQWHDDQGALMITLQDLKQGRHLYDDEFALYGPFYYVTIGKLFTTSLIPLSHDAVRFVSAGFWLVCAAVLSLLVHKITRSNIASGFAFLSILFLLRIFAGSPVHPQEIGLLMLALLPLLLERIERGPSVASLIMIGLIVSAATLTKLNLGAFIGAALMLTAIRISPRNRWLGPAFAGVITASLLLPLALMQPLFGLSSVIGYYVFASTTIGAAVLVWQRAEAPKLLTLRHWGICLASAVGAALVIIGFALLGGSTPSAILNATVLQNRHLIQNWYIEEHLTIAAAFSAFVAVGTALGYVILDARAATRGLARQLVLWLKLILSLAAIGLIVVSAIGAWGAVSPFVFQIVMPFTWLIIVPPRPGACGRPVMRGGIGLLAAFMVLYPFPVNGTQEAIAVALLTATLPVLMHDALSELRFQSQILQWLYCQLGAGRRSGAELLAGLMFAIMLLSQTTQALHNYFAGVPLDLIGARLVRADAQTVDTYQWLTAELSRCEFFYPIGGGLSFYFWAQKATPTGLNNNNPLGIFTRQQQVQLVADLKSKPDVCVLRSPAVLQLFDRGQIATHPPLLRYIDENFVVVAKKAHYELLKRRGSPS